MKKSSILLTIALTSVLGLSACSSAGNKTASSSSTASSSAVKASSTSSSSQKFAESQAAKAYQPPKSSSSAPATSSTTASSEEEKVTVVAHPDGNNYPITDNNPMWMYGDKKYALDNHNNCAFFTWQYIYDTYDIDVDAHFFIAEPNEETAKRFPNNIISAPKVGAIVRLNGGGKFLFGPNNIPLTALNDGHVLVITGVNPDGTFTARDSGAGEWGKTYDNAKLVSGYMIFDFVNIK